VKELKEQLANAEGIQRKGLVLAFLMRFKQICNHPRNGWETAPGAKTTAGSGRVCARLRSVAARQEKMLVFTQFREVTAPLAAFLGSVFERPGWCCTEKRGEEAQGPGATLPGRRSRAFFVLSLKAGGAGLNLTAASHVVHFDRWWNPAVENQATDAPSASARPGTCWCTVHLPRYRGRENRSVD